MIAESAVARFWQKVAKSEDGCWLWTGARAGGSGRDYGVFWDGRSKQRAHRISWIIQYGDIPDGLSVLHRCDNPPCVRHDHLFLGTQKDNMHDAGRKGRLFLQREPHLNPLLALAAQRRSKTHCLHGHPFDGANTYIGSDGSRQCRMCHREWNRQRRLARRAEPAGALPEGRATL